MTDLEYERRQEEVERLLNDPGTPMHVDRIWALLDELANAGIAARSVLNPAAGGN